MASASLSFIAHAAETGDMAAMSEWVEGGNVNQPLDNEGNRALHLVCQSGGSEDALLFLLGSRAEPSLQNHHQATPLHWACNFGNLEAVRVLLQFGADPLAVDNQRRYLSWYCLLLPTLHLCFCLCICLASHYPPPFVGLVIIGVGLFWLGFSVWC